MNVNTLAISPDEAARKVRIYGAIPAARRTNEDDYLLRVYRAVGKGKRLLDVARAFRETGLHPTGYPKLALARADTTEVFFHPRRSLGGWQVERGTGGFSARSQWDNRATRANFALPADTFDNSRLSDRVLCSTVPHLPPALRPAASLTAYHILFEADWTAYPVDPFLLRHVVGMLFVIEAEWDLTEVEATLLDIMHTT